MGFRDTLREFDSSSIARKTNGGMSRRGYLRRLGAAAAVTAGGVGVGSQPALGDEAGFEKTNDSIDSHDGTTIALSLYEPTAAGSHPAMIVIQGGAGTRAAAARRAKFWAQRGYVVLTYDPRGIGDSGGKVRFAGDRAVKDISELIDYLANQETVNTDDPENPRVGIEGQSIGGWRALRAASQANEDRVDAVFGFITPYNGADIIARNNVLNFPWTNFIYGQLEFRPDVTPTEDVLGWFRETVTSKEPSEELLNYFEERSPKVGLGNIDAPTLIMNSWHDRIIPARETFELYRGLPSSIDRRLVVQDLIAHDFERAPFTRQQALFIRTTRTDWFAKYLRDEEPSDGSPLKEPPIHFYEAQSDSFESYDELPDGEQSFPLRDGQKGGSTALKTTGNGNERRTEFDFTMDSDLDLAGVSKLSLEVTPTGGNPHLFAALKDAPPENSDEEPVHIKDQIAATEVTESGTVELTMNGVERTVSEGHTLRLVLTLNDDDLAGTVPFGDGLYVDSDQPTGVTIHHSRGQDSVLKVTTSG